MPMGNSPEPPVTRSGAYKTRITHFRPHQAATGRGGGGHVVIMISPAIEVLMSSPAVQDAPPIVQQWLAALLRGEKASNSPRVFQFSNQVSEDKTMSKLTWDEHKIRFKRAYDAIDARVRDHVGSHCRVSYAAYADDADDLPVDNLDDIPISGKVRFCAERNEFWGGRRSRDYRSPVLESPTWLEICGCANAMIRATGDTHHVFLEADKVVCQVGDVQIARFFMGS